MNAMSDIADLDAEPRDDNVERAEARLRALARLTDIGMGLAERLHEEVMAEPPKGAKGRIDYGQEFAKIARGVRMTIWLEEQLEKALRDRRSGLEAARRARALKAAEDAAARAVAEVRAEKNAAEAVRDAAWRRANAPRLAREDAVLGVMDEIVHREHRGNEREIERLNDRVEALLENEYGDYQGHGLRAVSETVRQLCEELDLEPEWERWEKNAWALKEAEAGVEGSPYVKAVLPPSAADSS